MFKDLFVPLWSKKDFHNVKNVICCWWLFWDTNQFVTYCLDVIDLIEYGYVFLHICFHRTFISVGCDDVNLIKFAWELLTRYIIYELLHYVCIFIPILRIQALVICISSKALLHGMLLFYCDISRVRMLTIKSNDANWIAPWWKCYCCSDMCTFIKGWSYRSILSLGERLCLLLLQILTRRPTFTKIIFMSIKFCRWAVTAFIFVLIPQFNCCSDFGITHEWYFFCRLIC